MRLLTTLGVVSAVLLPSLVLAQTQQPPAPSPAPVTPLNATSASPTASPSVVVVTSIHVTSLLPNQPRPSGAPSSVRVYTTFDLILSTVQPSNTSSAVSSASSATAPSALASPPQQAKPAPTLPLDTRLDAAFGVLGVLLLLSGVAYAGLGQRIRWFQCFVTGFYSLAIITICVILKVGVEKAVFDPSDTVRGLFLLAALLAGSLGGAVGIFWWSGALLLATSLGGLAFGLFVQALHTDGVLQGLNRWWLYIGCIVGFSGFGVWPRSKHYALIASAAIVGSTALVLGIDCFTTAGLKEFYARNLVGDSLFAKRHWPVFAPGHFPLVPSIQIELGVLGGATLISILLQSAMLTELRANFRALRSDDEDRETRRRAREAERSIRKNAERDLLEWEKQHGYVKQEEEKKSKFGRFSMSLKPRTSHGGHSRSVSSSGSILPMHKAASSEQGRHSMASSTPTRDHMRSMLPKSNADSADNYRPHHTRLADTLGTFQSTAEPPASATKAEAAAAVEVSAEQTRLLEEIATIRRNIAVLRSAPAAEASPTGSTFSAPAAPAPAVRPSEIYATTEAERRFSVGAAPWTTSDRSPSARPPPRPTTAASPAPSPPLATDVFGGLESPAIVLHLPQSASPPAVATSSPTMRPVDVRRQTYTATTQRPASYARTNSFGALSPPAAQPTQRRIIDTPEAAQARYAKAMNRYSVAPSPHVLGSPAGLTLGELEERHRAKMAAKQQGVKEELAVQLAREEWEARKVADKRAWEVREKFRRQEGARVLDPTSSASRQQAFKEASPPKPRRERAHSQGRETSSKRASGAAIAAEWRQSVASPSRPSMSASKRHTVANLQNYAPAPVAGFVAPPMPTGYNSMPTRSSMYAVTPAYAFPGTYSPPLQYNGLPASGSTTPAYNGGHAKRLSETDRRRISQGALTPGAARSPSGGLLQFDKGVVEEAWQQCRTSVHFV